MKKNKKKSKIKLSKFTYFVIGLDFLVTVALVIIYTPIVSFKKLLDSNSYDYYVS